MVESAVIPPIFTEDGYVGTAPFYANFAIQMCNSTALGDGSGFAIDDPGYEWNCNLYSVSF
jgi:hypothetical protein